MQNAQTFLEVVRSRGKRRLELRRVYRHLQDRELFLRAYAKLYANDGALTPGVDPASCVDGMSLARIDAITARLQAGTYQWTPARRVSIPKRDGGRRPLGLPGWNDKLLQEVIRTVLAAYYEPQFSHASHGFRVGRGCHTVLQTIRHEWKGTKWFIEGDIKGCFDNIDHNKLLAIIGRDIQDERFLKLLKGLLDAGYLEEWHYAPTYSGTPQGGVLSPLLANIYLNELDIFIEQDLIPDYTRGTTRKRSPRYVALAGARRHAKRRGDRRGYRLLTQQQQRLPSGDPFDPDYRRLRYVRYADDVRHFTKC